MRAAKYLQDGSTVPAARSSITHPNGPYADTENAEIPMAVVGHPLLPCDKVRCFAHGKSMSEGTTAWVGSA